jgi:branched-chain amino acid transport system substrate-binding protein
MIRSLLAAFTFFVLSAVPTSAAEPWRIAAVTALTGPYASLGEQLKAGVQAAVADLAAASGREIELEIEDDACDPKQAVAVAQRIVARGTRVVIGHLCSGASIAASETYGEDGVLLISPSSSAPALTDDAAKRRWTTIFRLYGRDDAQGVFVGKWLAGRAPGMRIAVLDDRSAYGAGIAREVEKTLRESGVTPVLRATVTPGERDFGALLSRLREARAELIYYGGYLSEAGLIVRQAREQGYDALLMASDSIATNEFWQVAGPAGEGVLFSFPPDPRRLPGAAEVAARLATRGGNADGFTLNAYAAVQALVTAARIANATDPLKLAAALRAQPVDTVLGRIEFDAKGDIKEPRYAIYRWSNGIYAERDPNAKLR